MLPKKIRLRRDVHKAYTKVTKYNSRKYEKQKNQKFGQYLADFSQKRGRKL